MNNITTFWGRIVTITIGSVLLGCDGGDVIRPEPPTETPTLASEWVSFVDWNQKTVIEVNMVESGSSLSFSPNAYTFEAGKPYVLRITNAASNSSKHYFSPEGTSFYKAIATRKIETAEAEYKAPYFDAVELQIGGSLEIYFVPVLAGTYDIICTIPGHKEAGMTATATITGGEGFTLDLEVAADFNTALTSDPRRSSSHAVWTSAADTAVQMFESASFDALAFNPQGLAITAGIGYKLTLDNPSGHVSKHYYTAVEFYKTVVLRKVEDSQAEIKAPYLKAIELQIGGNSTLFVVPTQAGTYSVLCTIPGHADLGMRGTIEVRAPVAAPTPTMASDWVGFVDWNEKTVIDVNMVESGSSLSYAPNELTFEAGRPYVLRINNPSTNSSKHYFSPEGTSFYQAIATRKIETADAEYKAPYFDAVELQIGGSLEIYFVPVVGGEYDIICTIPGHKALGMTATAKIVGGSGYQLDLEVAPDFDATLMSDPRRSGSHAVWTGAVDVAVNMFESASFDQLGFVPPDLALTKDVGYKLQVANPTGHTSKHYYTAAEFYKTVVLRKAEDSQAEIKAPYLKAIELLIGGSTTMFVVPTVINTFDVLCTITGHAGLGMTGTITVGAGP
ncbi:MAG: plastocyanin/azurin family copper-binding protein [Gemmatimonadales bacterium]